MGLFDQFPYTNFHELNLTWLLRRMEDLSNVVENFVALNTIKYADPIQWNITAQYEPNTVVIDPQSGTAYLSSKPIPAGVALTNTDYWSVIFTLDVISSNKNITLRDDGSNVLATFSSVAGDWLLWNGTLYKVSQAINVNEAYVVGYNLDRYTVEMFIADCVASITSLIGDLADLSTTDKSNVVAAMNEIADSIGNLADLSTTDKSNVVAAINEVIVKLNDLTTDRPYINVKDYGATGDGITDDYNSFVDAYTAATEGSSIIIPYGVYNLSANPDSHTKNIKWMADYGTTFTGAGAAGGLDGVVNGFKSPISNPYNDIGRTNSKIKNNMVSPVGGGICIDSYEMISGQRASTIITGTITTGSSVMTNVSNLDNIHAGDSIIAPTITGWLDGSTRANSVRVVSVDTANSSITFGSTPAPSAIAGDGWVIPTAWTGATQTGSFIIRPRTWNVDVYLGAETGNDDNIDDFNYLINGVLNINGGVGNAIELDVNLMGAASGDCTGLLLTGIGNENIPNFGIRINRGGLQNWTTGLDIDNAIFGIGIGAYQPILIRSTFFNNQTQSSMQPLYGIILDNINDMVPTTRPILGGEQIVNNATCVLLARADDATPAGSFITCLSKDRNTNLFNIDVSGNVTTPAAIYAGNYRINQSAQAVSTETVTKYIVVFDVNNTPIKLAVVE